jgi:hypothetical protein
MHSFFNKSQIAIIGVLYLAGAILIFVPYTMLVVQFDYPDVLRWETGEILRKFHDGGPSLIWTWWAFAVVGVPLLGAVILTGQWLENKLWFVRTATTVGVLGLVFQMVGLLRWTFVVPVIASSFVDGDSAAQAAAMVSFQTIHQYGGVVLGEHLGQWFTIIWTVLMTAAFTQLCLIPRWLTVLGYLSSVIYLFAQAELFATVMPGLPNWELAGFLGSSLWLLWLMGIGWVLLRAKPNAPSPA